MKETISFCAYALLMLAAYSCPAAAEDMTVFGIPLGARLQIAECEKRIVGTTTVYSTATAVCFQRLGSQDAVQATKPIENESILIKFPVTEAPPVMSGGAAVGLVMDGNLEGVAFNTRGVDSQDQVLDVLTQKFGKPTSRVPKQVQNTLGANFDVLDARWTLPQVEILFRSVTSRVDTGLLNIDTRKGSDYRKHRLHEPAKDGQREPPGPSEPH